ncbi:DUF6748 domain-containing protein [Nostoc sphaeroides]|uniref:DUF6748 domain-containing protein n=1 Tax=Nostoc sphaeroides TaxID=446679 RepID=UPI0030B90985
MSKKSIYYKYRLILLLGAILASFGFSPKIYAQNISAPDTTDSSVISVKNQDFPQWGYYTVRRDFRRCASPICGGFFIKQNNLKATPCVDGVFRNECYVSSINWSFQDLRIDRNLTMCIQAHLLFKMFQNKVTSHLKRQISLDFIPVFN